MKLTTVLLLAFCLHVSAKVSPQSISFKGKDVKLEKAFAEIKAQTGYLVIGNKKLLNNAGTVTISAEKMPLKQFLDLLLKNQGLQYSIEAQTIIVSAKPAVPATPPAGYAPVEYMAPPPPIKVIGYLLRQDGRDALVGATVQVKGTKSGVSTDNQGKFTLDANEGDLLVITYVGFETRVVTVKGPNMGVIYLSASQNQLDETVVMAYGTTTRRYNTGNIARVTAEDIAKQPVTNPLLALQGRMAGVQVTQANGVTGSKVTLQVRGQNFIGTSTIGRNDPLYVIDGVPFPSTAINRSISGSSAVDGATGETSPFNVLNPANIESIEILKDADASAIYGSRAANGVILITTKKGKAGKTTFSANVWTGRSVVGHTPQMLSTQEYRTIRKIAFANDGVTPTTTNAPDLLVWDSTKTNDFYDKFIGGTMTTTDANGSLSGGDARNKFLLSASYHKENTVFVNDQGYKRASVMFNNDHTSLDGKFNVNASVQYSSDVNNLSYLDPTSYAYVLAPNYPLYNANGTLNWTMANPLGYLNASYKASSNNLSGRALFRYTIIPGLDIKTSLGYNKMTTDQVRLTPTTYYNPTFNVTSGTGSFSNYTQESFIIEPQATYSTVIGQGRLNVLAGGTWQNTKGKMPFNLSTSGYTSDDNLSDPQAATSRSVSVSSNQYLYASLFGRVTYNWKNKYIVNGAVRRDGSSRFGPDKRFGNFGSIGAAWLFSEENFAKAIPALSFGKLRGSYGVAGNDQTGDYLYTAFYTTTTAYGATSAIVPSGIANPRIQWEVNRKMELATELGFLKDRILFNAAWYRNRSNSQLVSYTLSPQSGFTSYTANMPALVENSGWEFSATTININKGKLKYTTTVNITLPRNKLVYYPDLTQGAASTLAASYAQGYPLTSSFLYKYLGDDPVTGLPTFQDANKDGRFTNGIFDNGRGDYLYAGNTAPQFFGGLNNSLTYKNFQLDVFIQFTKQKGRSIAATAYNPPGNAAYFNYSRDMIISYLGTPDKWAGNKKITQGYGDAYTAFGRWVASDANFVDASFVRLKSVNLSYTLPAELLKKWHMQTIRLYMQAQNLFTITGYKGFDPETKSISLPPLRTITAGIQLTL
ncbi:SusC/RagA family TonB-linked outer membrane protein [Filimonas lacunae]|nr:SusC/RagA family TonB-linked outer membrane protein [Filimonas lacunae]